jgi:hypothetical protein
LYTKATILSRKISQIIYQGITSSKNKATDSCNQKLRLSLHTAKAQRPEEISRLTQSTVPIRGGVSVIQLLFASRKSIRQKAFLREEGGIFTIK